MARPADEHVEQVTLWPYSFACSCGVLSVGIRDDPALFSDHLAQVSADAAEGNEKTPR